MIGWKVRTGWDEMNGGVELNYNHADVSGKWQLSHIAGRAEYTAIADDLI